MLIHNILTEEEVDQAVAGIKSVFESVDKSSRLWDRVLRRQE